MSLFKNRQKINFYAQPPFSNAADTKNSMPNSENKMFSVSIASTSSSSVMLSNMPEGFSTTLSDIFTPFYYVSFGEPAQFATFQNQSTLQIKELYGQNPLSYYRVHQLGFGYNQSGQQYGLRCSPLSRQKMILNKVENLP
jgi:hypothetical protein